MGSYRMFAFVVIFIGTALVLGLTALLFQDIVTGWFQRRAAIRRTYRATREPDPKN